MMLSRLVALGCCALLGLGCGDANDHEDMGLADAGADLLDVPDAASFGFAAMGRIAVGGARSCAVDEQDRVLCWGRGLAGARSPEPNTMGLSDVTHVDTSHTTTCACRADGTITCVGFEDPAGEPSIEPVPVAGVDNCVMVAAGDGFGCGLREDATVSCWGTHGMEGQLGRGAASMGWQDAAAVVELEDVVMISAGTSHACALRAEGTVSCWGRVGVDADVDATVVFAPTEVDGVVNVVRIDVGRETTCAIHDDGLASCWRGTIGEFAAPALVSGIDDLTDIAVGDHHICAQRSTGEAWCWGQNWHGQLGTRSPGPDDAPGRVEGIADVASITAGSRHTCAELVAGGVACWGANGSGQLSAPIAPQVVGVPTDVPGIAGAAQVLVGSLHTCVLKTDGEVWCWGDNKCGQLGRGSLSAAFPPEPVVSLPLVAKLAMHESQVCALTREGEVYCWGGNASEPWNVFQSCDYTNTTPLPARIPEITDAVDLAVGFQHACVVHANRTVSCWGRGGHWDAGEPIDVPAPMPVVGLQEVDSIAAGFQFTCAVHTDRSVSCWGKNSNGQIGVGQTSATVGAPTRLPDIGSVEVRPLLVDGIELGRSHACALRSGGGVLCWGNNSNGQLGADTNGQSKNSPVEVPGITNARSLTIADLGIQFLEGAKTCVMKDGADVWCWSGWQHAADPVPAVSAPSAVASLDEALQIAVAPFHVCAVRPDGGVRCWGSEIIEGYGLGMIGMGLGVPNSLEPVVVEGVR
ncbi:MAG: alpha-tubulin suppressor-like RCC1 family protein [Myxococcota bacterium]|jgi:alpha-tubulin suppressor-like RCC1 family protein